MTFIWLVALFLWAFKGRGFGGPFFIATVCMAISRGL